MASDTKGIFKMESTYLYVFINVSIFLLIGLYRRLRDGKLKSVYAILIIIGIISAVIELPLCYLKAKETNQAIGMVDQKLSTIESAGDRILSEVEARIAREANDPDVNEVIHMVNQELESLSPQARHIIEWAVRILIVLIFLIIGNIIGKFIGLFKKKAVKRHGSDRVTVLILTAMDLLEFYELIETIVALPKL